VLTVPAVQITSYRGYRENAAARQEMKKWFFFYWVDVD
ncbi:unnamed protein product, partial [marine sediment metagenome]